MSELESILNYLETTSMEPHDDYTSEFSYKEQKVLWKYIKQLQQENKKCKEVIDKAIAIIDECKLLMPHEFDCGEEIEQIEKLLKEVE